MLLGNNSICSTRKDETPTVSASSDPFSLPTLNAKFSIKKVL